MLLIYIFFITTVEIMLKFKDNFNFKTNEVNYTIFNGIFNKFISSFQFYFFFQNAFSENFVSFVVFSPNIAEINIQLSLTRKGIKVSQYLSFLMKSSMI